MFAARYARPAPQYKAAGADPAMPASASESAPAGHCRHSGGGRRANRLNARAADARFNSRYEVYAVRTARCEWARTARVDAAAHPRLRAVPAPPCCSSNPPAASSSYLRSACLSSCKSPGAGSRPGDGAQAVNGNCGRCRQRVGIGKRRQTPCLLTCVISPAVLNPDCPDLPVRRRASSCAICRQPVVAT